LGGGLRDPVEQSAPRHGTAERSSRADGTGTAASADLSTRAPAKGLLSRVPASRRVAQVSDGWGRFVYTSRGSRRQHGAQTGQRPASGHAAEDRISAAGASGFHSATADPADSVGRNIGRAGRRSYLVTSSRPV